MLTSLSQKIRRMVDTALARAGVEGTIAAAIPPATAATSNAKARPSPRLVRAGETAPADRDIAIRVSVGSSVGASAFVAGEGARLYSLDVYRRAIEFLGLTAAAAEEVQEGTPRCLISCAAQQGDELLERIVGMLTRLCR